MDPAPMHLGVEWGVALDFQARHRSPLYETTAFVIGIENSPLVVSLRRGGPIGKNGDVNRLAVCSQSTGK